MSLAATANAARIRLLALATKVEWLGPLLLRITLGVVFVQSGWGKVHSLGDVTGYFASLGIPWPAANAIVASFTELVGGVLVLVGLGTRLASLPLAFVMFVAIITEKRGDIDGFASFVGLEEWSYLVMFLVLALRGAGPLSVDAWLARRWPARPPGAS